MEDSSLLGCDIMSVGRQVTIHIQVTYNSFLILNSMKCLYCSEVIMVSHIAVD